MSDSFSGPPATPAALYVQQQPVIVNSSTPTSVFAPGSTVARTLTPAQQAPGKSYRLLGAGIFTVPTGNLLSADIIMKLGATTLVSVTTPAAPVGTNAGIDFKATLTFQPDGTALVTGVFTFVVAGTAPVVVPFNSVGKITANTSIPNLLEVTGDWNGMVTTHQTVVQTASIVPEN